MTDPLRKGDLCVVASHWPKSPADGTYELTEAEREEMRSGPRYQGPGDDGESRLMPRYCEVELEDGELLIVERARVSHPRGRTGRGGYLKALSPSRGRSLWVRRMDVQPLPPAADKK